jgi:hypothetical protein
MNQKALRQEFRSSGVQGVQGVQKFRSSEVQKFRSSEVIGADKNVLQSQGRFSDSPKHPE